MGGAAVNERMKANSRKTNSGREIGRGQNWCSIEMCCQRSTGGPVDIAGQSSFDATRKKKALLEKHGEAKKSGRASGPDGGGILVNEGARSA